MGFPPAWHCSLLACPAQGSLAFIAHGRASQGNRGKEGGQVRFTRELYERFRHLIHELAKFGVLGSIAFLITDGGTNLLHVQAQLGPLTSNAVATIVATAFSFVGNRWWTFRHRERTGVPRETVMFFVMNGVGLAIQLACIG